MPQSKLVFNAWISKKTLWIFFGSWKEFLDSDKKKTTTFEKPDSKTISIWKYYFQTWYLSLISLILLVEKKLLCGEISAFNAWQLLGNWKFLHMWRNFRCLHMGDVEKSEILHIWQVCDVENVAIYAKFMQFSYGEKLSSKIHLWRKNDKY